MSPGANPTPVCRTTAGDREIAVPSLGLSLTQRRLLTLLDHPTPPASLAERSGLPPEKFTRDLGRLARFRLIEGVLTEGVASRDHPGETVTSTPGAASPPVTIRPAANASSMLNRDGWRAGRTRWVAATIAAAVAATIGYTLHPSIAVRVPR